MSGVTAAGGPPEDPRRNDVPLVLVIEDDPDSALGLAELLEMDGFRVLVAHDAETGVERARAEGPALVLCDIGLPGGRDGYDVARALRETPEGAGTRLVALTGRGRPEDRRRALEAGFDDHIAKPFDPGRLGARLRKLLEA